MARKKRKAPEFVTRAEFESYTKLVRLEMVQLDGMIEDVRGDLRDLKRRLRGLVVRRVKKARRRKK
jgi:hypothetical protein